jgi:hypothetical protein
MSPFPLKVYELRHALSHKEVMAAAHAFIESECVEQPAEIVEVDIRIAARKQNLTSQPLETGHADVLIHDPLAKHR